MYFIFFAFLLLFSTTASSTEHEVIVKGPVNVSFIKYWGKRDENLILPTKDSFGISLEELYSETSVSLHTHDEIIVLGDNDNKAKIVEGIEKFLERFRAVTHTQHHFLIKTYNNFPTASGLASSASGFSALATGLVKACDLPLDEFEISALARQGSGSAARAVCSGFVRFYKGERLDGKDSFAETIFPSDYWPEFRMIVVITTRQAKLLSSRASGRLLVQNPLYAVWSSESHARVDKAIEAVKCKNISLLGELMEKDWYDLQHVLHSCVPSIDYATETTHEVINTVQLLRSKGHECYFTTDAGPQVKIICLAKDVIPIMDELKKIPKIEQITECHVGTGAHHNVRYVLNPS